MCKEAIGKYTSAAAGKVQSGARLSGDVYYKELDTDRAEGCIRDIAARI